jgi:DNA-binding NtrC family response regulator
MAYGQALQSESALRIPQVNHSGFATPTQVAAQQRLRSLVQESSEFSVSFTAGTPLADVEKTMILKTLKAQKGNRTHTARILGIGLRTLQRKLKRYDMQDPDCII